MLLRSELVLTLWGWVFMVVSASVRRLGALGGTSIMAFLACWWVGEYLQSLLRAGGVVEARFLVGGASDTLLGPEGSGVACS